MTREISQLIDQPFLSMSKLLGSVAIREDTESGQGGNNNSVPLASCLAALSLDVYKVVKERTRSSIFELIGCACAQVSAEPQVWGIQWCASSTTQKNWGLTLHETRMIPRSVYLLFQRYSEIIHKKGSPHTQTHQHLLSFIWNNCNQTESSQTHQKISSTRRTHAQKQLMFRPRFASIRSQLSI